MKSGGPGSTTLFQVPVSTWYENDASASFLNALLPQGPKRAKSTYVRGLTRLQKLGNRRELLLRGLHVLVGVVPTGRLVFREHSADLGSPQCDKLGLRRGADQTRELDVLGRVGAYTHVGTGLRCHLVTHFLHGQPGAEPGHSEKESYHSLLNW